MKAAKTAPVAAPAFTEEQLIRGAWLTGNLDYLVQDHQQEVWKSLKRFCNLDDSKLRHGDAKAMNLARANNTLTLNIARRFGKTSLCFLALVALCLRNKGHTYLFVAPTEGDARDIISDIAPPLLGECPKDMTPKFKVGVYTFNNGSRIKIGGTWNGAEGLRGRSANGIIVDEAAHIPQNSKTSCLSYVLGSVLMPQLQTTRGFVVIASTPPKNLKHDYVRIIKTAEAMGTLISFDIYDNTSLTKAEIEKIKADSYQIDPTGSTWKREYLALLVPDANDLIIPEETMLSVPIATVTDTEHFEHLHRYISFDHGTKDLNVVLFGFYDYENARTVVQRELVIYNGPSTDTIAKEINRVKKELWGDLPVFRSICDSISRQIIIDLNDHEKIKEIGITFLNPSKVDLEAMVNQLIVAMAQGKYIIQPECTVLIDTLRTGTWKTSNSTGKREFARLGDIGHCDALASLVYLQRALIKSINPLLAKDVLRIRNVLVLDPKKDDSVAGIFDRATRGTRGSSFRR